MTEDGSVTHWIHELKEGNHEVARNLWQNYFARMVRLARGQMQQNRRRVSDEEDVAISVFESFCRAAEQGRFPDLADRDSLWRLLVRMTSRKIIDRRRYDGRQRRGAGKVDGESILEIGDDGNSPQLIAEVMGSEPTPEFTTEMTEQFELLMNLLGGSELKSLAIGKMEGYTNQEMAEKMGCSLRTIERRLALIREKCRQQLM